MFFTVSYSVFAAEPHEDPDKAEPVFSSISLLRYYSDILDFALLNNPVEVEARLNKIRFANIPQSLQEPTNNFALSAINLSHLMGESYEVPGKLQALIRQSRFDEAYELGYQTLPKLYQAYTELERIQEAIEVIDEELQASSAPTGSALRTSFQVLMEGIDRITELPTTSNELLENLLSGIMETLKSTDITLSREPTVAFVGDSIWFEGILSSDNEPLAGREVDILLNSSRYITVKTDAYGQYRGTLQVPFWYTPYLDLQAVYYPRDKDTGIYPVSLSPLVKLEVLFYKAKLEIGVEDRAYPGLETTVTGRFDYGESPPLKPRKVEIYVDDILVSEGIAQDAFTQKTKIDPEVDVGQHIITVSSPAVGRYSPADASATLNVTTASPVLDLSTPKIAMIPGGVGTKGRLYSQLGPLNGAIIKMKLGKSQVEAVSSAMGSFDTKIKVGMVLGIIGSQDLEIEVTPQEPWHAPLKTTSSLLMMNLVSCSGFIAIMAFLAIYLPGRLRRRRPAYLGKTMPLVIEAAPPQPVPTHREAVTVLPPTEESAKAGEEPRGRIFNWYRLIVRLIERIASALLGPQQTLREFAQESSQILGSAAKYFIELTKIVERLLYSQYRPTEKDVEKSQQLSHRIQVESTPEPATPPRLTRDLDREGIFDSGDMVLVTNPWKQLSTWLWVILIVALAYYACLLLFLLPLVLMSLAYCLPLVITDDFKEKGNTAVTKEQLKGESL